jgi:hypothetical protein
MRRLLGIFALTSILLILVVGRRKPKPTERPFHIRRTKSEVGYVYWILEGRGKHKCYVLCDSWQEAVAEANRRLQDAGEAPEKVRQKAASRNLQTA